MVVRATSHKWTAVARTVKSVNAVLSCPNTSHQPLMYFAIWINCTSQLNLKPYFSVESLTVLLNFYVWTTLSNLSKYKYKPPTTRILCVTEWKVCVLRWLRDALKKFLRDYLGIFPNKGGGGPLNSQNFCKLTQVFCQIHSEVQKHVLHTDKFYHLKFIWFGVSVVLSERKKREVLGIFPLSGRGGSPIPKSKCQNIGNMLTFWWKQNKPFF